MRLPLIAPDQLSAEQGPLADDMRAGIGKFLKGFVSIGDDVPVPSAWLFSQSAAKARR
jgi:hypothetical protein